VVHRSLRAPLAFAVVAALIEAGAAVRTHATGQADAGANAKPWVAQRARIEAALETAPIERLDEIGTGVTRPRRAHLERGGILESFTWKVLPPGRRGGYWESYKSEIAAYELDKQLEMNMVPPAVERVVGGERGAAVLWIEASTSVKQLGGTLPANRVPGRDVRRMQLFDNFIGNPDRNAGNILIDAANNLILIDHSRAFISDRDLPVKFERVDEDLWAAIQALTVERLRTVLGPLIGNPAIDAMIERRTRMAKAIEKLVAKKGRAVVIIPSDR
jgi:hypothetical protein